MAEQLDILAQQVTNASYFTVDNTQPYVATTTPAAADLVNGSGYTKFQKGDSFTILSAGINMPEAYTFWKHRTDLPPIQAQAQISLYMKGVTTGHLYPLDVFSENLLFYIPLENYESAFDIFVDFTKQRAQFTHALINEPFTLQAILSPIKVSMAGSPAVLNGKNLIIDVFFKILHNLPMYT